MFAARTFFGAGVIKPNLTNQQRWDINNGVDDAEAFVTFLNDGRLLAHEDSIGPFFIDREWMTGIITPSEASLYEVVVVKNSGTLTHGTAGTFNLGSGTNKWGCYIATNMGSQVANVTFSIRKVGTTTVLASATIDFQAYSSNA